LYHLSHNSAYELLGFQKESYVSDREINKALKRLFKQNYFENISVEYFESNETLAFIFEEKSTVSKVNLKGFMDSDDEKQKELLNIKKGTFLDRAKIEESKKRIIEALNFKGSVDNMVEVEETKLDNGTTQLEFIAREGEEIIIKDLQLEGADSLPFDDIENEMANREAEGFGWLIGRNSGEMKMRELEIDGMRIKDYYMQFGYLDAVVSKPVADIDFNRYSAKVKFRVEEGVPYSIRNINIAIDKDNILDINETLLSFLTQPKDVFNIVRFRKDLERLKYAVADKGYAFVQIEPDLKKDRDNQLVDITLNVTTGEKVFIRNVIVSGNRVTLDRVVRREVYLAPGDLYNLTDLKDSRNALGRLGYFDNINIEEKRVSTNEMDLVVSVEEGRTGMVQIGGGYSTFLGMTFDAGVSDKNVFGSGMDLGLSLQYSKISSRYTLSLTNPRLNDSLYSGSFSVNKSTFEYSYYTVDDTGFSTTIGRRFTRDFRASLGYGYSDVLYKDIDSAYSDYYSNYLESYIKSSIFLSGTYDTTDDYFLPREGVILSDSVEYAGVGGDAKFLKNTLSFNAYKGVEDYIDSDVIFRYKSKYRIMEDNGYIPLNESIHMGGIGSVRGYDPYAFPNRDLAEYKVFTALQSFTNSVEMSLPISKKAKLRWSFFVDYGWIGKDSIDDVADRGGYGGVLEWISPMAPIQFVFSRAFNDEAGDPISKFEFTMGRRF
jgi:outer membrane protein insertion porin family